MWSSVHLVSLWIAWVCVLGRVVVPKSSSLQRRVWLVTGAYVWGSAWLEACLRALALSLPPEAPEKTSSLAG